MSGRAVAPSTSCRRRAIGPPYAARQGLDARPDRGEPQRMGASPRGMTGPVPLLVLLLVLLAPATARSATPVPLGTGQTVGVTVDDAGTAYAAWNGNEPGAPTSLFFCRLPRAATACDVKTTLPADGSSLTRPYVLVDGGTVRVLSYRYGMTTGERFDAVYMFTSSDGGASFDGGVQIGTVAFHDAIRGPGNTVSMIENVSASVFQSAPLAPGPVTAEAHLNPSHPYDPAIALIDAGTPLAVFADGNGAAQFRRYSGIGDLNDANSWSPPVDFAAYAAYLRLAGGPLGVFALSNDANGGLEVRHFTGGGFDPPVPLPGPDKPITGGSDHIAQDAGGRLHVVWPFGDATGAHVGYASSDDGDDWAQTQFDVGDPAVIESTPSSMRVAVAPDHLGVATWHSGGGETAQAFAIAIGPAAAVEPPVVLKTANVEPVSGDVFVKLPAGASAAKYGLTTAQAKGFVPLTDVAQVPLGSTLDTTKGRVKVETAVGLSKPGKTQNGQFYDGVFQLLQKGGRRTPVTELRLAGAIQCSKSRATVDAAARRRRLWSNGRGRFRTRGRHSTATVRGTKWLTKDTCTTTTTQVRTGTVIVRDFAKRKNVTVRAGKSYTARAKRR